MQIRDFILKIAIKRRKGKNPFLLFLFLFIIMVYEKNRICTLVDIVFGM